MKSQKLLALSALPLISAVLVSATPAEAAIADKVGCPSPSKAEADRSSNSKSDKPPKGASAIKGMRVNHIPKGFTYGQVVVNKGHGITEYGYQWTDDRSEIDKKQRHLWVRVVCSPNVRSLSQLTSIPFSLGTFPDDSKSAKIGGRKVLTKEGDGALGHGRYVGWVERKGMVVTVMASEPLVPELDKIVRGIQPA